MGFRLRRFSQLGNFSLLFGACAVAIATLSPVPSTAEGEKQLARVKGVVGYQASDTAPLQPVTGRVALPDADDAVTQEKSAALVTLPDSSIVALGEKTRVNLGAFNQTADGPGSTVTIKNGSLRFDIKRPEGAKANYTFVTPTTSIAVRGTIGLLSLIDGTTTVACVACAADSVTVTVGTKTFTLLTGQILTVTAAGIVVVGALTTAIASTFTSASVSTSAVSGPAAATTGIGAAAGAAAVPAVAVGAAAAAAAAGVGIAAANSGNKNSNTPTPASPTPSPSPTATPVASPSATPTGSITLTGKSRNEPTPNPTPPPPSRPRDSIEGGS